MSTTMGRTTSSLTMRQAEKGYYRRDQSGGWRAGDEPINVGGCGVNSGTNANDDGVPGSPDLGIRREAAAMPTGVGKRRRRRDGELTGRGRIRGGGSSTTDAGDTYYFNIERTFPNGSTGGAVKGNETATANDTKAVVFKRVNTIPVQHREKGRKSSDTYARQSRAALDYSESPVKTIRNHQRRSKDRSFPAKRQGIVEGFRLACKNIKKEVSLNAGLLLEQLLHEGKSFGAKTPLSYLRRHLCKFTTNWACGKCPKIILTWPKLFNKAKELIWLHPMVLGANHQANVGSDGVLTSRRKVTLVFQRYSNLSLRLLTMSNVACALRRRVNCSSHSGSCRMQFTTVQRYCGVC